MLTLQRVDELNTLTRAKYPIIYIVSWEERRIEEMLRQVAIDRRKKLYGWTLTTGITPLDVVQTQPMDPSTRDPLNALDFVAQSQEAAIFVLKDFHPYLDDSRGGPDHPPSGAALSSPGSLLQPINISASSPTNQPVACFNIDVPY